jgi:chemotaxis protein MotB
MYKSSRSWLKAGRGEHEDRPSAEYWMTYSDLMAGLLMVFAVVLIVLMIDTQKKARLAREQSQENERQKLRLRELDSQTELTLGVRQRIVEKLSAAIDNRNVEIDPQTAAIRIGDNVLFAENDAVVAESGKRTLDDVTNAYLSVFLNDVELRPSLSRIIVEGHTNDNGSYIYNLGLSQQRAFNVMEYVVESRATPEQAAFLKKYLVASGRSMMDLRYKEGRVDKDTSRRIEIKFLLKDDEMVQKLREILKGRDLAPATVRE